MIFFNNKNISLFTILIMFLVSCNSPQISTTKQNANIAKKPEAEQTQNQENTEEESTTPENSASYEESQVENTEVQAAIINQTKIPFYAYIIRTIQTSNNSRAYEIPPGAKRTIKVGSIRQTQQSTYSKYGYYEPSRKSKKSIDTLEIRGPEKKIWKYRIDYTKSIYAIAIRIENGEIKLKMDIQ